MGSFGFALGIFGLLYVWFIHFGSIDMVDVWLGRYILGCLVFDRFVSCLGLFGLVLGNIWSRFGVVCLLLGFGCLGLVLLASFRDWLPPFEVYLASFRVARLVYVWLIHLGFVWPR